MDEESLKILQSGGMDDACKVLKTFNSKHLQIFAFPELTKDAKEGMLECVLNRLNDKKTTKPLCMTCLETVRIISREKSGLDTMVSEAALKTLVQHAGLTTYAEQEGENIIIQDADTTVTIEAQKCLCNIIFNSPTAQRVCSSIGCVEGIVQRMKTYKDPDLPHDVKFFDMRLLFLMTALCRDLRPKLRLDLHGFTYLIEVLDLTLRDSDDNRALSDQEVELCCEVLKILFNITHSLDRNNLDEEEEAHYMRLVSVLHDLLVCKTISKDKNEDLHNHTVNLLMNMPRESFEELLTPLNECLAECGTTKDVEYDGKNMEAIVVLLDFLNTRLDVPKQSIKEGLSPILLCLCEICRSNRAIRKFCRFKVLPHLKEEVRRLPEEGDSLRNKLCKVFTDPVTEVKDLAADFMFVLCKESVKRFVKYTGYGNAAGLLAKRGLMFGGHGAEYSSESEESETEEYAALKDSINPVTGRWEEAKPNPMENMTEEQKEYEAMQLVNHLDKLSRSGIIQPSTIGEDGRPRPMAHILELTAEGQQSAPPPPPPPPTQQPGNSDSD